MGLNQIVDGHIKELLRQEQDLYESRIKICRGCKLMTKDKMFGEMCDKNKWINLSTGHISLVQLDGYVNGCGCRMSAKARIPEARCPLNKW
jgi:hypothetical protein